MIDILPNRYESDLVRYFAQFKSKTQVEYFICDMSTHFRRVAEICFPINETHKKLEEEEMDRLTIMLRITPRLALVYQL